MTMSLWETTLAALPVKLHKAADREASVGELGIKGLRRIYDTSNGGSEADWLSSEVYALLHGGSRYRG